jgi:2-polyprenyl-3-methyl-5-hydroxy-6-metoxy-1,4-benzoquinol methylase
MSETMALGAMRPWLDMPIDAKTYQPTPYGRVMRLASGLGRVETMPTPAEVPAFYKLDAYYTQGQSHFAAGERETFVDKLRTHLAWRADRGRQMDAAAILARHRGGPKWEGVRVLDIGCGDGEMLSKFAALGCIVRGLDPDDEAVSRARERIVPHNVHVGRGEDAAAVFGEERFDVIVMSHALEHCIDPPEAVRAIRALLAPGGRAMIEVPNCAADHFETFNIISEMFDAPRHLWFFTPDSLRMLLEHEGFRITETYFHGFTRHFSNAWRATENRIRGRLIASGAASSAVPPSHSRLESAKLLLRTAFARAEKKYDCFGFFAAAN